ncbi:MAG: DUF21 domain-containing protein [Kiritimatiellae bacterium]|nr:DUF21 domain-containing protein [Kiritimatiellia bacterium]
MNPTLGMFLLVACCLGAWFFSGIETGLISINRLRLRHLVRRKVPGADVLQYFLQNPDALLGTTLVGTNICVTVASTVAASLGAHLMGRHGPAVAGVFITLVILTFCEYFPKAWFQSCAAPRTLLFAPLLKYARLVLLPLSVPLMRIVRTFVPVRRADRHKEQPFITREEIVHLASEGQTSGILTPAEQQMIHEVIQLKTRTCREVMTPRDRIVSVPPDMPANELASFAHLKDVGWVPVYDREKKSFAGTINVVDVVADEQPQGKHAADYIQPPQLVADYTPVDHILPRMRVTRQPLVFVCDDRMEIIGMVTLEDVLDEIVGVL